jgi:glycosyltransferase involved in cell wall biosynthesis
MPRAVGLVILDSFALQTPLITTNYPFHGPEIEYLENGINGLIVEDDPEVYAESVARLLTDPGKLDDLTEGCAESAKMYTLESMVDKFAAGVLKALESL